MLTKILLVGGLAIALYGLIGLIAVWLTPSLQRTGLWGKRFLTGRLVPTRVNQSLMCLWAFFFGGYVSLSAFELRPFSYVFAAAFLVCAGVTLVRRMAQASEA